VFAGDADDGRGSIRGYGILRLEREVEEEEGDVGDDEEPSGEARGRRWPSWWSRAAAALGAEGKKGGGRVRGWWRRRNGEGGQGGCTGWSLSPLPTGSIAVAAKDGVARAPFAEKKTPRREQVSRAGPAWPRAR
jgi:hypothetical protein